MPNARRLPLTRRGLLAAGGALGLGAALAACGDERLGERRLRVERRREVRPLVLQGRPRHDRRS